MITQDCMNRMLPIVADSWDRLRGCDVYRLLSSVYYEKLASLYAAGEAIKTKRPDLTGKVDEAVAEIHEEMSH